MKKSSIILAALLGFGLAAQTAAAGTSDTSASSIASYGTDWLSKNDGSFWIWDYYQSVPTQIPGLTGAVASYPGGLAVMADHSVKYWTNDFYPSAITIKPVIGLISIKDVYSWNWDDPVVLDENGTVFSETQTGDTPQLAKAFTAVPGIDHVADIEGYYEHRSDLMNKRNVFRKIDGTVWIDNGELQQFEPIQNLHDIIQIADHYALRKDGTVWTWPSTFKDETPPAAPPAAVKFTALSNIRTIKHNQKSNLAIDGQSRLWFWGGTVTGYSDGVLYADHTNPVLLTGINNVKDAFVARQSLIVHTTGNEVYATSIARDSMPANASFKLLAREVDTIKNSSRHMIMQKLDGSLWGWGVNKNSELGYGDYVFMHDSPVPVQKPVSVTLNGENVPFTSGVITRNGQNFVPLRSLFDKLGATVAFDGTTKLATVTRTDPGLPAMSISVHAKTGLTKLNNQTVTLANPPFLASTTLYLPLRFISEQLGAVVEWLPKEDRIAITLQ